MAGLSPWTGLLLAVVAGQLAYLYTRQYKRLFMSSLIGLLAMAYTCYLAYARFVETVDLATLTDDPAALTMLAGYTGGLTLVCLLNNVACAADVFWQIKKAQKS